MIKAILLSLAIALLMVGCGESSQHSERADMNNTVPESPKPSGGVDMTDSAPNKDAIETAVDYDDLEDRNGVKYLPNEETPFSGFAKSVYENGQVEVLEQFKGGKRDGLAIGWWENGQKWWEVNYKDGKQDGLRTSWYENGQKRRESNLKDGKSDGLWTEWYSNGQKAVEGSYKDGKLMSAVHWKPNGEKCPETNVKDGNGVWVLYNEDGTEKRRRIFKDGKEVVD